ncbi:uncharacterized protein BO96DRAFT_420415 [Aspergillus niger CBS 101883]|uniref:uncharacterized protein n=1 Tax=Aspergillus lacticoffeatus (strain CBS 101883) TaxID=1450533 RepID=UPI000D7FB040|nr:uncharacterized protein BO96DRAFT_420415 [Aspergillus niger CBS 101883]PYH59333.1 hypothetical protein BO96DRAFT_420415 [Aspergillus niger CBS 101883]
MMDSRDLVVYRIGTSPAHDIPINYLYALSVSSCSPSHSISVWKMLDANGIEDSTFQAVTKGPVLFQRILVQRPVKGAMDIVGRPMWVVNFIVPIFRGSKKPSVDQRSDFIGLMATSVEQ